MRLLLPFVVAAGVLVAPAEASACSCIPWGKPRVEVARANGAFVGVYLGRRPLNPPGATTSSVDPYLYKFRVERRLKGTFGKTVEVLSARDGASCGLEVRRGQRVGLLLRRVKGRWESNLCSQRSAGFFRGIPSRRLASAGCG
ncbi:MAG TPA: hypothetical protein VE444_06975 [Gaiellaceae bacterium]|nr:hypothetical protein [Gaiellaceae bacterium]